MTTRVVDIIRAEDTHANRPAATAVPAGAEYKCSTHNCIYRSDGTAWAVWAYVAPVGTTDGDVLTWDATAGKWKSAVATGGSGGTGDTSWTTPTMTNSWVAYGAPYAAAGYRKDGQGLVHIRGLIKNGTIGAAAFTLPTGYRPPFKLSIPTFNSQTSGVATMEVNTDGTVVPASGGNSYASLEIKPFYTT